MGSNMASTFIPSANVDLLGLKKALLGKCRGMIFLIKCEAKRKAGYTCFSGVEIKIHLCQSGKEKSFLK